MSVNDEIRLAVRQRANFACEFCGVSETDTGGELTIDHFQPQTHSGTDGLENLIYACPRCNQYKGDYWPTSPEQPNLWNPRSETRQVHFLTLADGILYPITPTGEFTLRRLRLNRPPLVAYRLREQVRREETQLLTRYRDIITALEQLHKQHIALLEEQRQLLEEQRLLLDIFLNR